MTLHRKSASPVTGCICKYIDGAVKTKMIPSTLDGWQKKKSVDTATLGTTSPAISGKLKASFGIKEIVEIFTLESTSGQPF